MNRETDSKKIPSPMSEHEAWEKSLQGLVNYDQPEHYELDFDQDEGYFEDSSDFDLDFDFDDYLDEDTSLNKGNTSGYLELDFEDEHEL